MTQEKDIGTHEKGLLDQFAISPIVEIVGVVSPDGAGGGRGGNEDLWTLVLTFDAWRLVGGDLRLGPLRITRKVTYQELDRLCGKIHPYTVIRIRARVRESDFGGQQALLEEFVDVDTSDADLNHYAEQLQQPVTFENPTFGTFTLERVGHWFTAQVVWNEKSISLSLCDSAKVQESLKMAYELWRNQDEWNSKIRDYAVQKLLPLKNENWLDEEEVELTPDTFLDRMTLESITVSSDGSFEFWYDDGNLFFGHSIQISGSLSEGLTRADIPG